MKKILFALSLIMAISLSTPGAVSAEPTHPNEVGLYTTADPYGPTGTTVTYGPVDVYVILTKPTDLAGGGEPYHYIDHFGLRLIFNPVPNNDLYYMGETLPPGGVNGGEIHDITQGVLDFSVGCDEQPVTNESALLMTLHFFVYIPIQTAITFGPASPTDNFAFHSYEYDQWGHWNDMHPISGSFEAPVFLFNGEAIPVESTSFGSVKALYR